MHESVALCLLLPDGEIIMQRRDENAPSSKGMLALWGGGVEPDDICRHHGALREASEELGEELAKDLALRYIDSMFYISEIYEKPIVNISLYAGEIASVPVVSEGQPEVHNSSDLTMRNDVATSTKTILDRIGDNIWR